MLAGNAGLGRTVRRLNVMSVPDILPWVKESELLLGTGYPLPASTERLTALVEELDARHLAALAVKMDKYLTQLPVPTLRRADELGFPILEIPHDVAFDDILSQVLTDIANREAATLIRAEEIHRVFVQIVLDGGGLPEITHELAALLGATVVVLDSEDRVLAQTALDEASDRLVAAGLIDAGGRLHMEELGSGIFTVGGARVAVVPVTAGALHYGRIVAVEAGHVLPDDTIVALERAATVAALDMTKRFAVEAVERKYQSDFLHDLLVGRADRLGDVSARSSVLGWNLDRPLVVIVAEPDAGRGPNDVAGTRHKLRGGATEAWIHAVRAHDRDAAAAGFTAEFVAIIGADETHPMRLASAVAAEMAASGRCSLTLGVSRRMTSPHELPEAYRQASRAVKVGRRSSGPGTVTSFDGLGVLRLLSLVEVDELRSFVDDTLAAVLALRPEERDDLLHTLTVLIDCNMNATEAARKLHYHYNTVRYRIAKLERLLGPFSADRHLCHRVATALQILQLRGVGT